VQEEVEMLLPLILPIPNIKKGSVDGVISRARSENTKPLDKMNFDNRRAMIKSHANLAFIQKEYAMALKFSSIIWE
jgi:hypothetical protein